MSNRISNGINLDRNEAAYDLSHELKSVIAEAFLEKSWNRYPGMFSEDLANDIAAHNGVSPRQILVDNGSSAVIRHLIGVYQGDRRRLVYPKPGFELFELCANIYGMEHVPWAFDDDMRVNYERYPGRNGSIYILCHPNNPTGDLLDPVFVESKVREEPDSIFIIDEAYIEFSGQTLKRLALTYPNAFITRSMSKAMGLAGIRLGYAICHEDVAQSLQDLQIPYRINQFTSHVASHFLQNYEAEVAPAVAKVILERERLYESLSSIFEGSDNRVYPSQANFLLLHIAKKTQANALQEQLKVSNISIPDVRNCPGHFRLTVGSSEENRKFLAFFKEFLHQPGFVIPRTTQAI